MRTTIVSTSNLRNYRTIVIIIDALILMVLLGYAINNYTAGERITKSFLPFVFYLGWHFYYPMFLKLKNVSYDESSIYYNKKGYEVQIPFEEIKSIDIKSTTGIYGINLYTPSQGEKEIYFKTSLWYPLNFKKKDEMVNELRDKIDAYKRSLPGKNMESLSSYNL